MGRIIKTSIKVFYRRMADLLCLASSINLLLSVFFAADVYRYIAVFGFVAALVFFIISMVTKR